MRLDPVARARIIDRALSLGDVVEKAASNMRKAGFSDDADAVMFSMMDLLSDLKGLFANPSGSSQEELRRVAAKVDGLLQDFSRRTGQKPRRVRTADDDVEEQDGDSDEIEKSDSVRSIISRRLKGLASEDDVYRVLGFEV